MSVMAWSHAHSTTAMPENTPLLHFASARTRISKHAPFQPHVSVARVPAHHGPTEPLGSGSGHGWVVG
eukprot:3427975-Prymnesium_polylepis.1